MSKNTEYTLGNSGPLAAFGAEVIDNGFAIVPIAVGKKSPNFDNWEKSRSTKPQLAEWIDNGHRKAGIGILTKWSPGVDLDIRDEELALLAEKKARKIFGDAPVRIGMAPKRLMVYRTEKPFKKMRSNKYKTPDPITEGEWELHQIEILCDGQQFVAYHTHPDTGRPYVWTDEKIDHDGTVVSEGGPRTMSAADLPEITVEQCQELIDWFEDQCEGRGWELAKKQRSNTNSGNVDQDNDFIEDTQPIEIEYEELRRTLMMVPGADDYDTWSNVGMALYHQFDGDEDGRALWHEWSETSDKYDADALDRRWDTFDIEGKKRAPMTARAIIKWAREAEVEVAEKLRLKLVDIFVSAKDMAAWEKGAKIMRESELPALVRGNVAHVAKKALDEILTTKTPVSEVKKALAYSGKNESIPTWASTWVYDTSDDRFFCTERKISVTKQGFDAMYDRKAMTKKDILEGRSAPSASASSLALNLYKIETIQGRRYEPGQDPIFHGDGGTFANTYPEHEIPEVPETLKPRDKIAINRVKNHIRHLLADPRERELFCDWLSWVVQNPGQHANWAILLQGVEGDGKSFFASLLRNVMGYSNIQSLNAKTLESDFTDWVVGQCVTCVEEVRLIKAHNKYEVLNNIKAFIANDDIEVHPKGKQPHGAKNTTNYLLFSNYRDALPLDDDGRRYCILFSKWQRKDKLDAFRAENPEYYADLYGCLAASAGALRGWLLNREQSPTFDAKGVAPQTAARKYMIRQAQPEFITGLYQLIEDRVHALVTKELLSVSALREALSEHGYEAPMTKAMSAMLSRANFNDLGRHRLGEERHIFYSHEPELFMSMMPGGELEVDSQRIKKLARQMLRDYEDPL